MNIPESKKNSMFLIIAFFLAQGIHLIPFSNQNTYMLHGLGMHSQSLNEDWLFSTTDPFPLFSALTYILEFIPMSFGFYIVHFTITSVAFITLMSLVKLDSKEKYLFFGMTIITLSSVFFNQFLPTAYLFRGVAGQGIFSLQFLQPSVFGVFLIASIAAFCVRRYYLSILGIVIASVFHASYLPYAAFLTVLYSLYIYIKEKDIKTAFNISILALVGILPYVIYILYNFSSTTEEISMLKNIILYDYRFPHHVNVSVWFGKAALIQCLIIAAGCFVAKGKLRLILITSSLLFLIIMILSITIFDKNILVKSPWRFSTVIIPICSALIINQIINQIPYFTKLTELVYRFKFIFILIMIILLSISNGILLNHENQKSKNLSYIHNLTGDGLTMIPPYWNDNFRLKTKTPIIVDFKSHPYKDIELIEWKQRMDELNDFYSHPSCNNLKNIIIKYEVKNVFLLSPLSCNYITKLDKYDEVFIYKVTH